jgi:mono/diheme cytochrome c family protein
MQAPVAQLDRASDFESEGREFESLRARQTESGEAVPQKLLRLIASCLELLLLGTVAQAQDPTKQGRKILKDFCASCHSIAKRGDSPDKTAPPLRLLNRSFEMDSFAQDLRRGTLAGHPGMSEFKLSEDDAHAVSAYLRTIQK